MDDNDENTDLKLSKGFDIGIDSARGKQKGETVPQKEVGTDYEDLDELGAYPVTIRLRDHLPEDG